MKLALAFVTYLSLSVSSFAFELAIHNVCSSKPWWWMGLYLQISWKTYRTKINPGSLEVTNMAGGGGGVAYAEVVNKRGGDII